MQPIRFCYFTGSTSTCPMNQAQILNTHWNYLRVIVRVLRRQLSLQQAHCLLQIRAAVRLVGPLKVVLYPLHDPF